MRGWKTLCWALWTTSGRHAITFDYPLYIVKYNTQQLLNSHLNSELGTNFLSTAIIEDICNVFVRWTGRAKVEEWSQHKDRPDREFVDKINTTVKEEARKWNIDEVEVRKMYCLFVYVVMADRVLLNADLFLMHKQKV